MGKKSQSMGFDPEVVQKTKSIVKNVQVTMANALCVFKKMEASNDVLKKGVGNSWRVSQRARKALQCLV